MYDVQSRVLGRTENGIEAEGTHRTAYGLTVRIQYNAGTHPLKGVPTTQTKACKGKLYDGRQGSSTTATTGRYDRHLVKQSRHESIKDEAQNTRDRTAGKLEVIQWAVQTGEII